MPRTHRDEIAQRIVTHFTLTTIFLKNKNSQGCAIGNGRTFPGVAVTQILTLFSLTPRLCHVPPPEPTGISESHGPFGHVRT